ncbi:MAG: hypothetical protein AB7N29_11270 [Vicinamibacterales bacterium]
MSCPLCGPSESAAIAAGVRAGVGTLIFVTTIVVAVLARFAWRLWTLRERNS